MKTARGTSFWRFLTKYRDKTLLLLETDENYARFLQELLRQGANFHHAMANPELCDGDARNIADSYGLCFSGMFDYKTRHSIQMYLLNSLLDTYLIPLEQGLDLNYRRKSQSIWQIWLAHICQWQTDHGYLEGMAAKAFKMFLSHGANPFERVIVHSDRIKDSELTVSTIVDTLFTIGTRMDLRAHLDAAIKRWQAKNPCLPPRPIGGKFGATRNGSLCRSGIEKRCRRNKWLSRIN